MTRDHNHHVPCTEYSQLWAILVNSTKQESSAKWTTLRDKNVGDLKHALSAV